jgi:peptidyl-prolyl cis-trans isomerase B (cyclophilin B)
MNKRFIKLMCVTAAAMLVALLSCNFVWAQQKQDQFVLLRTTRGSILIRVYYSMVPYTAGNFLDLVSRQFYDGLTFHRVEDWVVQGGDPNGDGTGNFVDPDTGNTRYIKLQADSRLTHNQTGMVAMARSASPNSASCQFYILKRPMPQLNGKYAVFGKVIKGINTVGMIGRGDRILMARIVDPDTLQPIGSGSGDGGGGGGTQQAVPGVAEPPPKQAPPSPTGDAGF